MVLIIRRFSITMMINKFKRAFITALIITCFTTINSVAAENVKKSLGAKTIAPPSPVWIIGSYDEEGEPNIMTASWVGVCCSKPPCVMISIRAATYTYGNIKKNGAYTVNIPSANNAASAAFAGTVSGRDRNKFKETGLTPVKSELVNAPYVKEYPLNLECKLIKTIELGLHTMFIGEIIDVKSNTSILGDNGLPDPGKMNPFVFSVGGWGFYRLGDHIGSVGELAKEIEEEK